MAQYKNHLQSTYLLSIFLCFCGCRHNHTKETVHIHGSAFGMAYHIQLEKLSTSVQNIIDHTFAEIDVSCNHWNPSSELSQFHSSPLGTFWVPSFHLAQIISIADNLYCLSEGLFDPSIGAITSLWKAAFIDGTVPSENARLLALSTTNWKRVRVKKIGLTKSHDGLNLDFDGILKGYTIDLLVERLQAKGFQHIYVEWGGDIRVYGAHPSGRPWKILAQGAPDVLLLKEGAVATSGTNMQSYSLWDAMDQMRTYTHIMDSHTGLPFTTEEIPPCCTVQAPHAAMADGLATVCLLFKDAKKREKWRQTLPKTVQVWYNEGTK